MKDWMFVLGGVAVGGIACFGYLMWVLRDLYR